MPENEANRWVIKSWGDVAASIMQQTFSIELSDRVGTAFLVAQSRETVGGKRNYMFATAWHVIEGFEDRQTITMYRKWSERELVLDHGTIGIYQLGPPELFDLALFHVALPNDVQVIDKMMPVRGGHDIAELGQEVGWYGFPASLGRDPLFIVGRVASLTSRPHRYLASGPAYPGMSGCGVADAKGHVVGVVSSWWNDPNLPQGPGLVQIVPSQMIRHVLEERLGSQVLWKLLW